MVLLKVVSVYVLIRIVVGERILINEIVDRLLTGVKEAVNQQGLDSINIDDLSHEWKYRWHFLKLTGSIKCREGKVKRLSTIRRTGDSYYSSDGNRMAISFALGLEELAIKFHCQVKAKHILQFKEKIRITVKYNSVSGEVSFTRNGDSCVSSLDQLHVDHIDGLKIHTGGGQFNKIKDHLLQSVYNHCRGSMLKNVSGEIKKAASARFASQNWCKDLPRLNSTRLNQRSQNYTDLALL